MLRNTSIYTSSLAFSDLPLLEYITDYFMPFLWFDYYILLTKNITLSRSCTFIYLPTEGSVGCFRFKAILNKAVINIFMLVYVNMSFQLLWGETKEYSCWVIKISLCLALQEPAKHFSQVLFHFSFPPAVIEGSCCSTS